MKRSHVPIRENKVAGDAISAYRSLQKMHGAVAAYGMNQAKNEYHHFKMVGNASKLPFSPQKRNRVEKDYSKFDKPNGYGSSLGKATYGWKVPTYDLNP